jgi:hypothetical protein
MRPFRPRTVGDAASVTGATVSITALAVLVVSDALVQCITLRISCIVFAHVRLKLFTAVHRLAWSEASIAVADPGVAHTATIETTSVWLVKHIHPPASPPTNWTTPPGIFATDFGSNIASVEVADTTVTLVAGLVVSVDDVQWITLNFVCVVSRHSSVNTFLGVHRSASCEIASTVTCSSTYKSSLLSSATLMVSEQVIVHVEASHIPERPATTHIATLSAFMMWLPVPILELASTVPTDMELVLPNA